MKEKKILAWVKAHKKELAVAAGCAVGGIILCAIARKNPLTVEMAVPELGIGKITELWKDIEGGEEFTRMIVEDVPVTDLGRFGEELVKSVESITPESTVSAIMGFARK